MKTATQTRQKRQTPSDKKPVALITFPPPREFLESEVTVSFRFGAEGHIDVTRRVGLCLKDMQCAIHQALPTFTRAVSGLLTKDPDESPNGIHFELRCFLLEENLLSTVVEVSVCEIVDADDHLHNICALMVARVRPRFLEALEKHCIVLS